MDASQQEAFLESLREVGLNRYEASVYLGLINDQTAKVTQISKRTGVPQPKVYQALDSLVEKGFCRFGSDVVNRYQPVPPRVAFDAHINKLKDSEREAHELANALEILLLEGQGQELWAPPIEVVKGLRVVRQVLVEKIQQAEREMVSFGKRPHLEALDVTQALWEACERGCAFRMAVEADYLAEDDSPEEVGLYREMKGERRRAPGILPTKLLIIDQQVAIASIRSSNGEGFLGLILRDRGLVQHFLHSFEYTWERSEALD